MLGLGEHLLPVVPDPKAVKSPTSKVAKFGKIPSAYDREGRAFGLKDWQKRDILSNEVALWSKDPRLGMCVRTGSRSGVYAIDVDIEDQKLAFEIALYFSQNLYGGSIRTRANSPKFLLPIEIHGRPAFDKRIIETPHGRIEFLADGQQFVVAGVHPSGERYYWKPDPLPGFFPAISVEKFEDLWAHLSTYGKASVPKTPGPADPSKAEERPLNEQDISAEQIAEINTLLRWPAFMAACGDNELWSEVGYALLSLKATGREIFCAWSREAPGYSDGAPEGWWAAHESQQSRTDYRHLYTLARRFGYGATADSSVFPVTAPEPPPEQPPPESPAPDLISAIAGGMDAKPILKLTEGNLDKELPIAEKAMREDLYQHAGQLVRIGGGSEVNDGVERNEEQRVMVSVYPPYLKAMLTARVHFQKFDGRRGKFVTKNCPIEFAQSFSSAGQWPYLRRLDAIARSPYLRADGSINTEPGYDAKSCIFYIPNADYPAIPDEVTPEMAAEALAKLREPFNEFPYYSPASESTFIAHILTEAARVAVDTAPMIWYTAPDAGTGKTLLGDIPALLVHGTRPAHRPWVGDNDEMRKALFASLLSGDRSLQLDNAPKGIKIRSDVLNTFLTSEIWRDRKLGVSESVTLSNRIVLSASGNNITPASDLSRRSLVCRLDGNTSALKARRFRIPNLKGYVREHRVELLVAAFTIIRGWQQHSVSLAPEDTEVPLPSFEEWSHLVRDPIIWLGMTDPVNSQEEETDSEQENIAEAFRLLGTHFGRKEFTAISIRDYAMGFSDPEHELTRALTQAGCQDVTNVTKIGYWLRDCRDRIGGPFKLIRARKTMDGVTWEFKRMIDNEDLL